MKLTETHILPGNMNRVHVEGNCIYDYSTDGRYDYSLHIYRKVFSNSSLVVEKPISKMYFNRYMSPKLFFAIHDIVIFNFKGIDCDITYMMNDPVSLNMVCDYSGKPVLRNGFSRLVFHYRLCEYMEDYGVKHDGRNVCAYASFGRGGFECDNVLNVIYK